MKNKLFDVIVTTLIIFLFASTSYAQGNGSDVYWRIDPNIKDCSMVIDPTLTQGQWNKFTKQVGAIITFKSLASAEPLGKMNFIVGIDYAYTPIDQHDLAWINTFTHPDEDCPLGDAITYPIIRARMGVSDNIDVGAYWTSAPEANYGMVGGELKYKFLQESEKLPAAAVRASVSLLTGVDDYNLNVYSVDLIASKKFGMLTPYVGIKESFAVGTETTSKVDLDKESILITQGYVGVAYSIWMLTIAAEYNVSYVNPFALVIGFNF